MLRRRCDPGCSPPAALVADWPQQVERVGVEPLGDPLDRLEGEVALASLYASHVGAVDAQHVGESLLAERSRLAVGTKTHAKCALQVSFHALTLLAPLLLSLQTYR